MLTGPHNIIGFLCTPLSLSLATGLPYTCNCFGCLNGKRPLPGKCPGNVSQDCEDNGDEDDLDPLFDSDE